VEEEGTRGVEHMEGVAQVMRGDAQHLVLDVIQLGELRVLDGELLLGGLAFGYVGHDRHDPGGGPIRAARQPG